MKRLMKSILIAFGVVSLSIVALGIVSAIRQGVGGPTGRRDPGYQYVSHNGQGSVVVSLALLTLVVGSFFWYWAHPHHRHSHEVGILDASP